MEEIKKLIADSGMKKKHIARMVGIHPAYLSQLLSGHVIMSDKIRARIVEFLQPQDNGAQ